MMNVCLIGNVVIRLLNLRFVPVMSVLVSDGPTLLSYPQGLSWLVGPAQVYVFLLRVRNDLRMLRDQSSALASP